MKKQMMLVVSVLVIIFSSSMVFAGVDIIPWSYPEGDRQVFSFSFTGAVDPQMTVTVAGPRKKKNTIVTPILEDQRIEVSVLAEGDYLIYGQIKTSKQLSQNISRLVVLTMGFPVKVGKIFFLDHSRMHLAEGNVGYNFIVYPQFGYVMPDHVEAEMSFGDVVKAVSFSCGQNYVQNNGYCTTDLVEFSPEEYQQVVGDTYTCFKSDETESCRIMRYYNFK
jgi:hypothetical protein